MATQILFSFGVEQMLIKLSSFAADEISCAWGLKAELKRMAESTKRIRAVVQDAEDKQAEDDRVRPWLLKLQDVVYAAEDVLDKFAYESLRRKVEVDPHQLIKGPLRNFFSRSNPVVFRLRMAHQVKEINESLAEFEKQATSELTLRSITATTGLRAPLGGRLDRETDSRLDVSQVPTGREDDVSTIINMLVGCSPSSQQLLTVVSVVGMAGLGKTTLAKLVFNRAKELKLFGHTIWYCVSEDFDHKKILRAILQALGLESAGSMTDVESMLNRLDNKLQGENFLLVLDDVWNEDSKKWYSLKDRLEKVCKKSGNVVLVTTRSKSVASKMETQSSHMHELKGLSNDECWSIIKQQVCKNDVVSISCELEMLGKAIAKRCGGVPLAAAVVGGILRSEGVESWSSIKENKVWDEVEQSDGIMPILKLSFDGLPSPIKQCFAYCSLFSKDYEFQKTELVEMWMAEGFLDVSIKRERRGLLMEELGDVYFNHLLANSFFQDTINDSFGNITHCKMHDLVHDLALSVSKLETFIIDVSSKVETSNANLRRLSLTCDDDYDEQMLSVQGLPEVIKNGARKLHSFFSIVDVFHMSPNFKSLRTLSLAGAGIKKLPESIGKLKHLRYIDISLNSKIEKLPLSITKLYNLQTLRLFHCRKINELPKDMKYLVSLRHIYFDMLGKEVMLAEVGHLTNLQTLPLFIAGIERGYKIEEFGGLKELRGDIRIARLEHVRDGKEAASAKLHEKTKLSSLNLQWSIVGERKISSSSSYKDEQVLEGLLPPPSLQCLQIWNYIGKKLPSGSWMPSELVQLDLYCSMCEVIPTLGHLPHLKFLQLNGMWNLKSIGMEFYRESSSSTGGPLFPSLKEFTLREMESLVEWVIPVVVNGGDETSTPPLVVFPCLDKLVIEDCPCLKSLRINDLSSLLHLEIIWCDDLSYLPNDTFYGLTSLQYLKIDRCKSLESLPSAQNLKSLKELMVLSCGKLTSLPRGLQFCMSLETFNIRSCGRLSSFPEDILGSNLTQLEELGIGGFWEELEEFPGLNSIHHLSSSLKSFSIYGWGKLKSLPHQFQHLTSLTHLSISHFDGLKVLPDWIGNLSSLNSLKIQQCKNLTSLLTATSMQHLYKLERLQIRDCPLLKERCAKNKGLEWSNISHIPTILIDGRRIH